MEANSGALDLHQHAECNGLAVIFVLYDVHYQGCKRNILN